MERIFRRALKSLLSWEYVMERAVATVPLCQSPPFNPHETQIRVKETSVYTHSRRGTHFGVFQALCYALAIEKQQIYKLIARLSFV